MIGRKLSHYEIIDEINRGGMGVVYRAVDVNLRREVALKILPEELVHDAGRRERLLQEARAASALEHPNIAVIHAQLLPARPDPGAPRRCRAGPRAVDPVSRALGQRRSQTRLDRRSAEEDRSLIGESPTCSIR